MKPIFISLIMVISVLSEISAEPIRLHPQNGHYLIYKGVPTVLITSTEHYGAVLNLDFDYITYLNELQSKGLNLTRTFSGVYHETKDFIIVDNPLSPPIHSSYCAPWARSSTPGAADGGNKFDLNQWNTSYFTRLKDFIYQAEQRGIIVEFTFFSSFYGDELWNVCPMKSNNNINGIGDVALMAIYTDSSLVASEKAVVTKIVQELKDYDNIYYEICNEPFVKWAAAPIAFEDEIIATIVNTESTFKYKHLIAQNRIINSPNPNISIFNIHYCKFPYDKNFNIARNYKDKKVIADDETGEVGPADSTYRMQGWNFIIGGGGIFNNLDWSFTFKKEDGTAALPTTKHGGGGKNFRNQMKILKDFIHSFNFINMLPNNDVLTGGIPTGATARVLVETGKQYAVYVKGGSQADLLLSIMAGSYKAEWVNTKTGTIDKIESFKHTGGNKQLSSPSYSEDIALRILSE